MASTFAGIVNAPEFPVGLDWLNTESPISLEQLRGKLVVLNFWSSSSINCLHTLPKLRKLEEKHRDSLVVIGVHSPKFDAERDTASLRQAIERYGVHHPAINDAEFTVWQSYGVAVWPTLMFIDPEGKVTGRHEGEFAVDELDRAIQQMIAEHEADGKLIRGLLPFQQPAVDVVSRPLSFPGKVEVDVGSDRLFIADSNHHRVLVSSLDGKVKTIVGNGKAVQSEPGEQTFDQGVFENPQGMAVDGDVLYVADAGSHTIKRVDLNEKTVKTIAGNGQQSFFRHSGGKALVNPLSSPYDLVLVNGVLYIAMAGFHQLWSMDLETGTVAPFAGSGVEGIEDGPRNEAMLAQPYGIAAHNETIYFVDSGTSSVRMVDTAEEGEVVTLVGTGLFDFGDREGIGTDAALQNVQGLAVDDDVLYISDTFNNRIRHVSIAYRHVLNLAGSGVQGSKDGRRLDVSFNKPGGVAAAGSKVWVADTNSHAIRIIDQDVFTVTTLELSGL